MKLIMKVSKIVRTTFEIDLKEWYSWESMTEKERHNQINSCLENAEDLLNDGGINTLDTYEEIEVLEWDLK